MATTRRLVVGPSDGDMAFVGLVLGVPAAIAALVMGVAWWAAPLIVLGFVVLAVLTP